MNKLFEYPEQLLWDRQLQILHEDATKQCILEENSVDLIVASPLYNLGKAYSAEVKTDSLNYEDYLALTKKWLRWLRMSGLWAELFRSLRRRIYCAFEPTQVAMPAMRVGMNYHPARQASVETIIVLQKEEWKRHYSPVFLAS